MKRKGKGEERREGEGREAEEKRRGRKELILYYALSNMDNSTVYP